MAGFPLQSSARETRERNSTLAGIVIFWACLGVTSSISSIFLKCLWKDDMQARLANNDQFVDWLDFGLDFSNFVAVVPGLALDRFGAVPVLCGSALMNFFGYGGLVLALAGKLPSAVAFPSMVLMGQAGMWTALAILGVCGRLVQPVDKGKVVGVAMTWFSLAPVVISTVTTLFLGDSKIRLENYILSGSIMILGSLVGATVLTLMRWSRGGVPVLHRGSELGSWIALAFTSVACIAPLVSSVFSKAVALFLPVALSVPLVLALTLRFRKREVLSARIDQPTQLQAVTVVANSPAHFAKAHKEGILDKDCQNDGFQLEQVNSGQDVKLSAALKELRFWLLFIMLGSICGAGMEVSNHLSRLAENVGWQTSRAMAIFAVGNSVARLLLGWCSDLLIRWISRGNFLIGFTALMAGSLALLATLPDNLAAVQLGVALSGFAFGTPWTLVPAVEIEWYGHAHFGSIHGLMLSAADIGLIGVRLSAMCFPEDPSLIFRVLAGAHVVVAGASAVAAGLGAWRD